MIFEKYFNMRLNEISQKDIDIAVKNLKEKGLKSATINRKTTTLKAMFSRAKRGGFLVANVEIEKIPELKSKPPKYYSKKELKMIYEFDKETEHWWKFLANTGLRLDEFYNLKCENITETGIYVISTDENRNKSKKWRKIPVSMGVNKVLKDFDLTQEYLFPRYSDKTYYNKKFRRLKVSKNKGHLSPSILSKFLIDLSWKSSSLEGSSYSLLDTKTLVEYGEKPKTSLKRDDLMILNHIDAIKHLVQIKKINSEEIKVINQFLLKDGLDEFDRGGILRGFTELEITHSTYIPATDGVLLNKILDDIVGVLNQKTPIEQSFYLFSRIPYAQFFSDGNKRSARLLCNQPLLSAGLSPISMVDINKNNYLKSLLVFYELGDDRLLQEVFLKSYIDSILRYSNLSQEQRIELAKDKENIQKQLFNCFTSKGKPVPSFFNCNNNGQQS
ncbi:Fic family protein [Isorropodon fossajaponicum symbiont]|uniref:Fic family protein n=1 Tax=Isorropodon fossajaponicum symbiont TaxID=883811 RepID=UPI001914F155|nr:Fic family protein [Isorropodon fossajaponicum symbiont]